MLLKDPSATKHYQSSVHITDSQTGAREAWCFRVSTSGQRLALYLKIQSTWQNSQAPFTNVIQVTGVSLVEDWRVHTPYVGDKRWVFLAEDWVISLPWQRRASLQCGGEQRAHACHRLKIHLQKNLPEHQLHRENDPLLHIFFCFEDCLS